MLDELVETDHARPVAPERRADAARQAARSGSLAWLSVKRAADLLAAAVLLLLLAPVLLAVAIAVRVDSGGPVVFRQRRIGRSGREFTLLKFRTMRHGASSNLHQEFIDKLAAGGEDVDGLKKLTDDPRVTRVGSALRRTSLDELPQLVNILLGQMSLVGPRPALEYELRHYAPEHFERFGVRPGLTGLWQVSGRSSLDFRAMLDLDVRYARTSGPATDVRILLRTPAALLGGRAA